MMRFDFLIHLSKVWRGILLASLIASSSPVLAQSAPGDSAQNVALAQKLYDDAMLLMAEKKYAEACPKLAESNRLDTGMGTRFHLADCYENLGRLASAHALFTEIADEAQRTKQTGRETVARERAKQVEGRLPKVTLQLSPKVATISGVEVRDNDNLINTTSWGRPLPMDLGDHTIVVKAPGRRTWQKKLVLKEAATETIVIENLAPVQSTVSPGPLVLASVGVANLVVGSIFGLRARSKWREEVVAKSCVGGVITQCDLVDAQMRLEKSGAQTDATISTVTFVVGGASLAAATVWAVWPRAKSPENIAKTLQVHFIPMPSGGGFFATGAF